MGTVSHYWIMNIYAYAGGWNLNNAVIKIWMQRYTNYPKYSLI